MEVITNMSKNQEPSAEGESDLSRRDFTKAVGALGAVSASSAGLSAFTDFGDGWPYGSTGHGTGDEYGEYGGEDVVHTTCGLCHANCPVQVRIDDGEVTGSATGNIRKIAGNPYAFQMTYPYGQVPYGSDLDDVAMGEVDGTGTVAKDAWSLKGGRMCLKGQSGMQVAFDEYRLRQPLKRAGGRGEDQWETISWEDAIDEIVNGDDDLGHDGLKEMDVDEWYSEEEVMSDWEELSQDEFDEKYEDFLIDTEHPDLGPKTNQIADIGAYRRQFIRPRLWQQGLGSVNSYHHAGTCGITCLTAAGAGHAAGTRGKGYQHVDWRNCEYFIAWGANPLVATKGPVWSAAQISNARQDGMRMDVVDPRLSETAEKADKWVPVKPGADAALAHGMARWILENDRYDETFLTNPCQGAAAQDGEPNWADATHLVLVDEEPQPKASPADLGIGDDEDVFVAIDQETGEARATNEPFDGELFVDTEINGHSVKSVFQLYEERVYEHTLEEYAEMAGVDVDDIVEMADEFTSHGKKVGIQTYRGPSQHSHGFYNVRAVVSLQHLVGCYDHKGGQVTVSGTDYNTMGGRYDLGTIPDDHESEKDPRSPWGLEITRASMNYEDTTLYDKKVENGEDPYPAERPWFATSAQTYQEVIPSAAEEYPYGLNALFIRAYGGNLVTNGARGDEWEDMLADDDSIDLIVACDTVIGETTRYADYILPEPTYLERWEEYDSNHNTLLTETKITRPAVNVFGDPSPNSRDADGGASFEGPTPFEDVLIDIWKEMDFAGVGEDAYEDDEGNTYPLDRAEDFWLKLVANVAYDEEPVPDATDEEVELLRSQVENGLDDESIVDEWATSVADEDWRKVVTVLNRGGRYEPPTSNYEEKWEERGFKYPYADRDPESNAYDGEHLEAKMAARAQLYNEGIGASRHSYDGEFHDPLPDVRDPTHYNREQKTPIVDLEEDIDDDQFQFITWKHTAKGLQRTEASSWLREVQDENPLWINAADAEDMGVDNGDAVVIETDDGNEIEATARVTQGIRPGTVGGSYAFGREANNAMEIDVEGDEEMPQSPADGNGHMDFDPYTPGHDTWGISTGPGRGFVVNHVMELDEELGDTGSMDVVGGSHAQYDSTVEVRPK